MSRECVRGQLLVLAMLLLDHPAFRTTDRAGNRAASAYLLTVTRVSFARVALEEVTCDASAATGGAAGVGPG